MSPTRTSLAKGEFHSWYDAPPALSALSEFASKLARAYIHDHDTLPHAVAAVALGAVRAFTSVPNRDMDLTQARLAHGYVSERWPHVGHPTSLIDYSALLDPSREQELRVPLPVWRRAQDRARVLLRERLDAPAALREHWRSIVHGRVPFGLRVADA